MAAEKQAVNKQPENTGLNQAITLESLNVTLVTLFNRYYLVISVICVIIVLVAVALGIVPAWNDIMALRREISQNQAEENKLETKYRQLQLLTDDASLFASKSAMLDGTLYSYKPFLETLYAISNAAALNSVAVNRFEFTPGLVATEAAEIENSPRNVTEVVLNDLNRSDQHIIFEITVAGGLRNVAQFIHDLERSAPAANVSIGTLTQGETTTTARIEVYVYYYNRELDMAVDAALPVLDEAGEQAAATLSSFLRPDLTDLQQDAVQGGGKTNLFLPYASYLSSFGSVIGEGSQSAAIEEEVASGVTIGQ